MALKVYPVGFGTRLLEARANHGVEGRIECLNAGDCRFEQFGRTDLAAAHQCRQAQSIMTHVLGDGKHRSRSSIAKTGSGRLPVLKAMERA